MQSTKCEAAVLLAQRRNGIKEVPSIRKQAAARANLIKARAAKLANSQNKPT